MNLLIGLGNPTRQDDGAGWEVARCIAKSNPEGVEVRLLQQLAPELVEDWDEFDRVLLVDASAQAGEVSLEKVREVEPTPGASTHHFKPETLLSLALTLYGKAPELFICSVPGEAFGFGDSLSPLSSRNVRDAVSRIRDWITLKEGFHA